MKRIPIVALGLILLSGCSTNSTFVYKPVGSVEGWTRLPVKVAVLPFKDGTEDFTKRGSVLAPETLFYNMAKAGIGGQMTALTPDLWAKAFSDELAASGGFQAVRFVFGPSELVDEELAIDGTLEKAIIAGAWTSSNEFAIRMRAVRRADNRPVWEKEVARSWKNSAATLYEGCGPFSIQCMVDRHHADANRVMQGMFAEATADLMGTLAATSGSRGGAKERPPAASPRPASSPESVDGEIERILKD